MKKLFLLLAVAIGFVACGSDEPSNPFEGKSAEEIIAEEGGVDYLIQTSRSVDESMITAILKSGKVLYNDYSSYRLEDGKWVWDYRAGAVDVYLMWMDEQTLRACYETDDKLYIEHTGVYKVYREFAPNNADELSDSVWGFFFYGPSDVLVTPGIERIGYVESHLIVTYTDHHGKPCCELIRVRNNREELIKEYCNKVED